MHYRILVLSALFTLPACGKDSGDTSAEGSSGGDSSGTTQTDTPTGTSTGVGTSEDSIEFPTTMVDDSTTTTGPDPSTSSSTTAEPSTTDAESSSSGGSSTGGVCAKCSEIIMGADPATLCPESQDEAMAFQDCICKECNAECAQTCMNGAEPDAACGQCGQAAAFGACAAAFQACAADI